MNPKILQALDKGVCVVTATRRLAYEVKAAYNTHQLKQGKAAWPSPLVNTWDSWVLSIWQAHSAHTSQLCLNPAQLQQLFSNIIEADIQQQQKKDRSDLAALWNIPATAKTALDAWQLCHQWQISFTTLKEANHADHAGFGRWATKLYARLSDSNWISPIQIVDKLIAANGPLMQDTILFGFDNFDAQQRHFIRHHESKKPNISRITSETNSAKTIQRYTFENTREEWQHIGAWARNKLREEPTLKIGIITPNSEKIRTLASQCLREQLTPQYFEQDAPAPFHFSQGQPLTSVPLIDSALACLDLLGSIEFKQLVPIFLSSYWGNKHERYARIRLLNPLGKNISYQFDLFQLNQAISGLADNQEENRTKLLTKLHALQKIKSENRGRHSIAQWREVFRQCLDTLQWPGSNLSSTEFQAQQAWDKCLDDWLTLDTLCQPMVMDKARQSLKQHCQQMQYQAQAAINAPVQIMGVLEAAELDFDAVWLAGFDEQAWPVTASANPFIPIHHQIDTGVPAASFALQLEYAMQKTAQLCALCNDVRISHALVQDDINLSISPLFTGLDCADLANLPKPFSLNDAIRSATPPLTCKRDDMGQALAAEGAKGGTGLIQAQSACPFRAYAQYRLIASEPIAPEIGMDNMQRGRLLHTILASIWAELKTSKVLHHHIEQGLLATLINRHTQKFVARHAQQSGLRVGFEQAQTHRLNTLISQWLSLEATRPAFSVEDCEQNIAHTIDGLKLNFTLDRVDQIHAREGESLSAATRLIMDYKSGLCELKHWAGDRPEQPQVPLYYLALDQQANSMPIEALAFGQVKQGMNTFIGISRDEGVLPEVKSLEKLAGNTSLKKDMSDWAELKPKWDARLTKLVNEFQQGLAHVDPATPASCDYCEFGALCRVGSSAMQEGADDTD